jgi:hypothetical protein
LDTAITTLYESLFDFRMKTELYPEYEQQLRETRLKLSTAQNLPFSGIDAQKLLIVEVAFAQRCALAQVECLAEALEKGHRFFDTEALNRGLEDTKRLLEKQKKNACDRILSPANWAGVHLHEVRSRAPASLMWTHI